MTPYYEDDFATIYHGDAESLLVGEVQADAILTDPPYGVGIKYGEHYNDRRADYWDWLRSMVAQMRAAANVVAFTHRVTALRHLEDWDWIACWNKPRSLSGLIQFPISPHWEPIFVYGIQGRKDLPRRFDVFSVNPAIASDSAHPCPKPVGLYTALVDWLTLPNHTVLDPFMGSGTTLVAAKSMGRKAVGIEGSEAYCEIAAKRLSQEVLDFGGVA